MSTREYTNGKHDPPSNTMNLRQLYIGGVPSHVVAPYLTNRCVWKPVLLFYLNIVNYKLQIKGNKVEKIKH